MKLSGIYKIQSKLKPERSYIGSAVNLKERWRSHLQSLKNNKHHSSKIQRHYNKYSADDFIFIIIEPCFPEFLLIREQFYIDKLNPYFNICKKAGSRLGVKCSEESNKRISDGQKGKIMSEESKQKISASLKGRIFSPEHKLKISKGLKGKAKSALHIKNNRLAQPYLGKKRGPMSDENKIKISRSRKGKPHPHKGHVASIESKLRSSISHKGQIAWNKGKKGLQVAWNKGLSKKEQLIYKNILCDSA